MAHWTGLIPFPVGSSPIEDKRDPPVIHVYKEKNPTYVERPWKTKCSQHNWLDGNSKNRDTAITIIAQLHMESYHSPFTMTISSEDPKEKNASA